jgi:hypothetical protein
MVACTAKKASYAPVRDRSFSFIGRKYSKFKKKILRPHISEKENKFKTLPFSNII